MRRNFNRGFKSYNNSSNYNRDRRNTDRDDDYRMNSSYKRPAERRDSSREFVDKKFRRSFDNSDNQYPRSSFSGQDRRDGPYGGGNRSFRGRNRDGRSNHRSPSPPSRFKDDKRSDSRIGRRSNDFRQRSLSPVVPAPPKFRDRQDTRRSSFRPQAGRIRKTIQAVGSRIRRRHETRGRLPSGGTGSREYLKRMKEARSKMNDDSIRSESGDDAPDNDEEKEENDKSSKADEEVNEEDFLDIGNDVDLEDDGEASTSKVKIESKKEGESSIPEEKGDEDGAKSDNDETKKSPKKREIPKRDFIEFYCPHCDLKTKSIKEYLRHLKKINHNRNVRSLIDKVQQTLNNLRKLQRRRQFEIETMMEKVEDIPSKYCQICKLYYRQSKLEHRDSEDHKKIRNFIHPYCKICETRFMAPLKYEEHKCSVGHLKMKARRAEIDEEDDDDMFNSFDLGDFKTVDSIGDVDGEDDSHDDPMESVGEEFVNAKQVLFCDICTEVVTFEIGEDDQKVINEHCKTRRHNRFYRRHLEKDTSINLKDSNDTESKEVPTTPTETENHDANVEMKDVEN